MNTSRSASGGDLLSYHPNKEDIARKQSLSLKERMAAMTPEERKQKFGRPGSSNANFGNRWSDAQRQKAAERRRGILLSQSTKDKLSETSKRYWTEQAREDKRRNTTGDKNPFWGRAHSEETKEKIRKLNSGKIPPNRKAVYAEGATYESLTAAARVYGITPYALLYRIRSTSPKFSEFYYTE